MFLITYGFGQQNSVQQLNTRSGKLMSEFEINSIKQALT